MKLQTIIDELSPLNTNEKVDEVLKRMTENRVMLNPKNDMILRFAIRKVNVQLYYRKKYELKVSNKEICQLIDMAQEKEPKGDSFKEEKNTKSRMPEKEVEKKKVKKRHKSRHPFVPRILRTFGANYTDKRKIEEKRNKDAFKLVQDMHKHLTSPSSPSQSIHPIYIPTGGMNKRY